MYGANFSHRTQKTQVDRSKMCTREMRLSDKSRGAYFSCCCCLFSPIIKSDVGLNQILCQVAVKFSVIRFKLLWSTLLLALDSLSFVSSLEIGLIIDPKHARLKPNLKLPKHKCWLGDQPDLLHCFTLKAVCFPPLGQQLSTNYCRTLFEHNL